MKPTAIWTKSIIAILAIQIGFLPVSFALKIQIRTDTKLREEQDGSMERVGLLKRGTIIEIPDEFAVDSKGRPISSSHEKANLELTLNNWLRTGGKSGPAGFDGAGRYSYDGEKHEFYFPVRVTQPKKGSTVAPGHENTKHYIALKYLARTKNAMIVTEDAPIELPAAPDETAEVPGPPTPAEDREQRQLEATTPCAQGLCSRPSELSAPVRSLMAALAPALKAASKRNGSDYTRTDHDLANMYSNFQKSCGLPLLEFTSAVKERAKSAGVPPEILLSLMTQESSGKCYALNSERDTTQSVGLFQINSASSRYPRCTNAQKNILKNLGHASRLSQGPRCLENPLVNLDESIRILKDKRRTLTSGKNGFDETRLSETDAWRLAVSAYNGGPRWVLEAKKDLEKFNAKNGTELSPYNWEDLRLFYLRMWLNRNQQNSNFGSMANGRSRQNSIINLAYAENVMGREATATTRPALTTAWLPTVRD
jgi:hypothetical protein